MITPNTDTKLPKGFFNYQIAYLAIVFVVTLPLNFFLFIPIILLTILFFNNWLSYKNFSFIYDEKQIEIRKGILTKSRKSIPFSTIQDINIVSGILMRRFGLEKIEIWTSSPAQIQIQTTRNRGTETEHKPDGVLYLKTEDAESLRAFIVGHK